MGINLPSIEELKSSIGEHRDKFLAHQHELLASPTLEQAVINLGMGAMLLVRITAATAYMFASEAFKGEGN